MASVVVVALSLVGLTLVSTPAATAAATSPTTYKDYVYPSGTGSDGPTADKPQSKLWFNDGSWWALMVPRAGGGVHIQKLVSDHTWTDTGTVVDSRTDATSDALWSGGKLYTVSRNASGDIVVSRFSYSGGTYSKDSGFPITVGTGGTESASLDKDTTGALWVVWTKSKKVLYTHSTAAQTSFTPAAPLPVPDPTVFSDDIASVIAFKGKIGVFWSDHATGSAEGTTTSYMRFATHTDGTGDATSNWTVENIQTGTYSSDDHINLKTWEEDPKSGTVYAAFKTSYEDQSKSDTSKPQIIVAARHLDGSVDKVTAANVGTGLTRPQLLINSSSQTLYVFMTAPESGGTIYAKTAPLSNIAFTSSYDTANSGKGTPFVTYSGAKINNVSVSKDPVTDATGIVALAADSAAKTYYHAEQGVTFSGGGGGGDTTAPSAPTNLAAAVTGTDVKLTWTASTDNTGVTGYTVFRNGTQVGTSTTTSFTDSSVAAGTYSYTVKASDAAGNVSAASNAASATVTGGGGDTTAPSAPTNLAAAVTGTDVKLTWTASTDNTGVTGYTVFRNGTQVGTSTTTSFTDSSVAAGTYSYTVKASDAAGNVSAASNAASATVTGGGGGGTGSVSYVGSSRTPVTAASSVTVSAPSGTTAGDTLLVALSSRGTPTFSAPSGWTLVRKDANGSTETQAVYSHTFAGGESSYSFGFGKSVTAAVGQIVAYSGATGVSTSAGAIGTTGSTLTAPSIASGTIAVTFFSQAKSATLTAQSPLTGRGQATASGSSIVTASSADAARSSGTYSATSSGSSAWVAQTVGLNG